MHPAISGPPGELWTSRRHVGAALVRRAMARPRTLANFSKFDNVTATDGGNRTAFDAISERVASALYIYYTPLLVVFGSIGNLVSIFVFFSSKLRFQSTSQYLSALALSDTVFLLQLVPPWMNVMQMTGLFTRNVFCQVFVYVSYVTCCLSAWLVVAFTVERFVAVLHPLRRNIIFTVTRARYIIVIAAATALLLNVPVLRFAVPTDNDCNIDYEFLALAARFNLVDTAVSFTVPLGAIIVLNCWITVGVCRLERARLHLVKSVRPTEAAGRTSGSQHRVTRMLLLVSSVFVLFNLPAYTMRLLTYAYDMDDNVPIGPWAVLQQVALMCFHSNFGINFILYCLSGQKFRQALRQTIPRLGRSPRRIAAGRRRTSSRPGRQRASSISTSMVSYTEPVSNLGNAAMAAAAVELAAAAAPSVVSRSWRWRSDRDTFIRRWTFDNSRQHRQRRASARFSGEPIEMQVFAEPVM